MVHVWEVQAKSQLEVSILKVSATEFFEKGSHCPD